jgi:large subunit ribosomal protein L4
MQLVIHSESETKNALEVSDDVFGVDYKPSLVHQIVTAYLAGGRSGTKAQKNRAAVNGGGSKPYRQKGTGRARAGTTRSPLWRGGGKTFPASPRSFAQKVNRKMYRGALRSILSELVRQERLIIVPELDLPEAKTKALVNRLTSLNIKDALLLVHEPDDTLMRAARNLPNIDVATTNGVDPVSLIAFDYVVATQTAIAHLNGRLL